MKRNITVALLLVFATMCLPAQDIGGFVYGLKGGLCMGLQKWNNVEKDVLFAYSGLAYIESLPSDGKFSVFAQTGYHVRGSAVRARVYNFVDPITNMNRSVRPRTRTFEFNNISLGLGAKQRYPLAEKLFGYYMLGIRGEYTLNTNLCTYNEIKENGYQENCPLEAFDNFTQRWNYGMILGGGLEFEFAERIGALVELSVNPDVSYQYRQPANVPSFFTLGGSNNVTLLSEQLVRNVSVELSVGIRLLRIVEYID
jgi:hypothetical protein